MILYPAIDLKDGACVRLIRGRMDRATVFGRDPAAQAARFAAEGFRWLHVVDLNGAFAGHPVNGAAVEAIIAAVDIPIQLGGGIRTLDQIETWLGRGVTRVILGTAAVKDPALVARACAAHPGRIAVGIDARDGFVATDGWAETSTLRALDLARRFEDCGVACIIHTDIDRDGAMGGVNLEATADLAAALTTPVIASGGVSSLADLRALRGRADTGIEGVICGRALYDGAIDRARALALMASRADA